jgi:thymidylate synthase (FAD)
MIKALIKGGHEAMLEHASLSVRFCTDRAITHELVRHRLAAFAQESQRYVNYSGDKFGNEIQYVEIGSTLRDDPKMQGNEEYIPFIVNEWIEACEDAERHYLRMLELGASPQIARSVLNNSTRTEIVVTANMREWRHILKLRAAGTTGAPHPAMKALMMPLLEELKELMPELFGDID